MTTHEFALSDLAARLAGTDASLSTSLRDILTVALQELIEAELTATIGAAPGERTTERVELSFWACILPGPGTMPPGHVSEVS